METYYLKLFLKSLKCFSCIPLCFKAISEWVFSVMKQSRSYVFQNIISHFFYSNPSTCYQVQSLSSSPLISTCQTHHHHASSPPSFSSFFGGAAAAAAHSDALRMGTLGDDFGANPRAI